MKEKLYLNSFISELIELKDKDITAFYYRVFDSLREFPEEAILDESPKEDKILALNSILNFFIEVEEYEKCSFIKQLIDQLE